MVKEAHNNQPVKETANKMMIPTEAHNNQANKVVMLVPPMDKLQKILKTEEKEMQNTAIMAIMDQKISKKMEEASQMASALTAITDQKMIVISAVMFKIS